MKKLVYSLIFSLIFSGLSFAQNAAKPADLLKDKANFSKTELFELEAVFADMQANQQALEAYLANPAAYKDEELLPLAICFMTFRNYDKTKELLEKFLAVRPDNTRATRTYGTLMLLSQDKASIDKAFEYYEKGAAKNDEESIKSIATAAMITGRWEKMEKYIPQLKAYAKTDLNIANILITYAYRNQEKLDKAFAKEIIASLDVDKILDTASADALGRALVLYNAEKSVWTPQATIIPANGATLNAVWGIAREAYNTVLAANPENTKALRGRAVVEYNLGGVMESADLLQKAIKLGDKLAVSDAMNLAITYASTFKSKAIFDKFSKNFANADFDMRTRLVMFDYALKNDNEGELFYMALKGKEADEILKAPQLKEAIEAGIKKYESNLSSAELKQRMEALSKNK